MDVYTYRRLECWKCNNVTTHEIYKLGRGIGIFGTPYTDYKKVCPDCHAVRRYSELDVQTT